MQVDSWYRYDKSTRTQLKCRKVQKFQLDPTREQVKEKVKPRSAKVKLRLAKVKLRSVKVKPRSAKVKPRSAKIKLRLAKVKPNPKSR